jgi:hypothetical protein
MAAFRYAILSHLKPPKLPKRDKQPDPNFDEGYDKMRKAVRDRLRRNGAVA